MTSNHFKILTVLKIAIGCDVLPYRDGLAPDIINYCVDEVDKDEYLRLALVVLEDNYGIDDGGDIVCGAFIRRKRWPVSLDLDNTHSYLSLCDWAFYEAGLDLPVRPAKWAYPVEWGPNYEEP